MQWEVHTWIGMSSEFKIGMMLVFFSLVFSSFHTNLRRTIDLI